MLTAEPVSPNNDDEIQKDEMLCELDLLLASMESQWESISESETYIEPVQSSVLFQVIAFRNIELIKKELARFPEDLNRHGEEKFNAPTPLIAMLKQLSSRCFRIGAKINFRNFILELVEEYKDTIDFRKSDLKGNTLLHYAYLYDEITIAEKILSIAVQQGQLISILGALNFGNNVEGTCKIPTTYFVKHFIRRHEEFNQICRTIHKQLIQNYKGFLDFSQLSVELRNSFMKAKEQYFFYKAHAVLLVSYLSDLQCAHAYGLKSCLKSLQKKYSVYGWLDRGINAIHGFAKMAENSGFFKIRTQAPTPLTLAEATRLMYSLTANPIIKFECDFLEIKLGEGTSFKEALEFAINMKKYQSMGFSQTTHTITLIKPQDVLRFIAESKCSFKAACMELDIKPESFSHDNEIGLRVHFKNLPHAMLVYQAFPCDSVPYTGSQLEGVITIKNANNAVSCGVSQSMDGMVIVRFSNGVSRDNCCQLLNLKQNHYISFGENGNSTEISIAPKFFNNPSNDDPVGCPTM